MVALLCSGFGALLQISHSYILSTIYTLPVKHNKLSFAVEGYQSRERERDKERLRVQKLKACSV